jgi:hypothetical protein
MELEGLKGILSAETFKEPSQREDSKKQLKKLLEDRYTNGKNKWFFAPIRVCVKNLIPSPLLTMLAVLISSFISLFRNKMPHVHFCHHVVRDICPASPPPACQIPFSL